MENMKEAKEAINETKEEEVIKEVKTKKEIAKHWDKFDNKKDDKKIFIIIAIILIVLGILSTGFALVNVNNENMMAGITINGVNVQGLNKEEAKKLIEEKIQEKTNNEVKIYVDDEEQSVLLSQIELTYNVEKAIEEAYKIGREKNIFVNNFEILKSKLLGTNIELSFKYNEELLNNVAQDIKNKVPEAVTEATYCIEDEELIITRGTKGNTIDENELKNKILQTINLDWVEDIRITTYLAEPKDINIEQIYEEVHTKMQDAYYTTNPFKVYPEVKGVDFNLEEAKEIIKEEKDEYVIPLVITNPTKTTKDIGTEAFPDRLSTFQTRYDATNLTRTNNLQVAVNKINGVVVMPGETFSYNKTLGKRTAEAGYKDAAGYAGGKVVQMIGGGICQISSTLYDAVVYANLEIVERHNHAFLTSYVGAGKDATVVYGSLDFQFKNTRKYPIKIESYMQNGIATVNIYGIKEENEYEVEISTTVLNYIPYNVIYENDSSLASGKEIVTQGGQKGCKSITYKILKQNGKEVSRSVLSTDTYSAMNKYVTRGTKGATQPSTPVVAPPEPTTPETPAEPEIPTEPETPVEPEAPVTPEEPEVDEAA
ncbi:MAG: VanW family protein [Clostridia bacterium]|nr:VanW family protein [Clostridia bacterium]